jgi:hypothetical protein
MGKSLFLIISLLVGLAFAQPNLNYNGYGDTAKVVGLTSTGTVYSKLFKLSQYLASRFDVFARDTNSAAGITNDSLQFLWGVQMVHPMFTSTGTTQTYKYGNLLTIDTLDMWASAGAFLKNNLPAMDTLGFFPNELHKVDTVSMSGWASQSRLVAPPWDVYFRFFATGLARNKKGGYVSLIFQQSTPKYLKVGN